MLHSKGTIKNQLNVFCLKIMVKFQSFNLSKYGPLKCIRMLTIWPLQNVVIVTFQIYCFKNKRINK